MKLQQRALSVIMSSGEQGDQGVIRHSYTGDELWHDHGRRLLAVGDWSFAEHRDRARQSGEGLLLCASLRTGDAKFLL